MTAPAATTTGGRRSVDVDIVIGVMVRFDMASYTVGEAGTLSYKLIARTGPGAPQPSSATSIIEVVSEDGTASINTDFAFVNFSKAFTAANFSADGGVWKAEEPYTVSITNDALAEDDETFNLTIRHAPGAVSYSLVDASGNSCGTECEVTVTITDDDTAGVTVSKTALTVTEEDTTGDSYTIVLDSEPAASVTVTVAGHASTSVNPTPTSLTFTTMNWDTAQTVTVKAVNDANTVDETVSLTHAATSTDTDYDGITINGVTVMVEDNDTAQVTGLMLTPGDGELAVAWAPLANATGYEVQWKSGGQSYNTSSRQATISSGSTASHTIPSLTNGTTYTVRMRATRTGANAGPYSDEAMDAPEAAGVTVSKTALTVTEQDTTGDSYTVVLDSEPAASVTVTVAGHASTSVNPTPTSLTFTTMNWETAQTVTVKAVNDANTVDETVSLTHAATSTDTDYDGITINGVTVMVEDNDTAKVTGLMLTPGDGELAVAWAPLANATGYEVQWKSGGQSYNNSGRQATISSGSTASHTIPSLTNGTTYTVRMRATRTGANNGPYSDEAMDAPEAAGVTVSKTALTVTEEDTTGDSYTIVLDSEPAASVTVTVAGHASTDVLPAPTTPDVHVNELGDGADGDGESGQRCEHGGRNGVSDPRRDQHRHRLRRDHDQRRDSDGGRQRHRTGDRGGAHPGRRGTRGGVGAVGQRDRLRGAVEVGRAELQQQRAAGHDQFGFDREPHDPQPHQRDHVHGADESDPHGRQRRPVFG